MLTALLCLALQQSQVPSAQAPLHPIEWRYRINFQSESADIPGGYLKDFGQAYGPRTGPDQGASQGFALRYGWSESGGGTPKDLVGQGRERGAVPDPRLDTFMHMDLPGSGTNGQGVWEMELRPGDYTVRVTCGDPSFTNSSHRIVVEGLVALSGFEPSDTELHGSAEVTVTVADGRLTLDSSGGTNTKINFVEISRGKRAFPQINAVNPFDGATDVPLDAFLSTDLYLPRAAVDASTVSIHSIRLYPASAPGSIIPAVVNTTGGGDALILDPLGDLAPQTDYVFEVTEDVRDLRGVPFVPFTSHFRTVSNTSGQIIDLEFERETVASGAQYTSLEIGPDRRLYCLLSDGRIHRYRLKADGTLTDFEEIVSLVVTEGGSRLAIGMTHDPGSTEANPVVWVSHTTFGFADMPDWGGKISRLSGPSLGAVETMIEELPRSTRDHVTNSLSFGPDGGLYFAQGGNNAMGAPDSTWANREERLLSAAVLRLDTAALDALPAGGLPLNVRTAEGGTYDPLAPGAPLTLYATGLRNGYDLVWHSNGSLYIPGNGSASGGNAPASPAQLPAICALRPDGPYVGPAVPGITGVSQSLHDFLMRIEPGGYYGHPNPARCEWVLNGGNPTQFVDPAEILLYPVGTQPDPNFRGYAFDFENNKSPNGVIEYQSDRFEGSLRGSLIVARYSGGDDLMVLRPSADGSIAASLESISTFDSFFDPLDVTEDTTNGNLYVSEYGGGTLTLLRPVDGTLPGIEITPAEIIASAVQGQADAPQQLTLTNEGLDPLEVLSIDVSGPDAAAFLPGSTPALPAVLSPGENLSFELTFSPPLGSTGSLRAQVTVSTDRGSSGVQAHGLSAETFAGAGEAPLARIVETLGVSVDVGGDQLSLGTDPEPIGEEVIAPLFTKAGPGPVTMTPVARYSPAYELPFGYYLPDGATPATHIVGTLSEGPVVPEHQTLFPELSSGTVAFDPGADTFGCFTTSSTHSVFTEDTLNELLFPTYVAHGVRVYPYVDRRGFPVPDAWLIGFEEATNGDYQDYV
ncbi:MAG: Ig-like domain-containing protein, partial [Planctomycetota bacterium]